jgi:hypothetical protein
MSDAKKSQMPPKLFCFGYGYCSDFLGYTLMQRDEGWRVAGTTRDPDKARHMKEIGLQSYIFNMDYPLEDARVFLKDVTHLLISTPPGDEGDPAFLLHGEEIAQFKNLKWVGYLSSTGVYGDRDGGWVDETSEIRPSSKRGSRRARAERQWMSLFEDYDLPVHIFRIAGIYGPQRSALDTVRSGIARRIDKPGHAFSRIHVDDIVQCLIASMDSPAPGNIYNLCDDEAAASGDVIAYACTLLDLPVPPPVPYEEANLPPMARSFYNDNKRVHNDKVKDELGVTLKYPTYREGLEGCLAVEQSSDGLALEHDVGLKS